MVYDNTRLRREIGRYLRTLPDKGLTTRYRQSIRHVLVKFNAHCAERGVRCIRKVDRETISTFIDRYSGMSASYQSKVACAIRVFLTEFDNKAIRKMRIRTSGPSRIHVDWLTPEDTNRIMVTEMSPLQAVLIGAGLLQGMRRIETLRLTTKDAEEALKIGVMRIRGKGYRERAVPLQSQFRGILQTYLRLKEPGGSDKPLLGIRRRTFGRNLWLLGVRLETISELLGHTSTDMTRLYLGLNLLDMRNALSIYRLPDAYIPDARTEPAPETSRDLRIGAPL